MIHRLVPTLLLLCGLVCAQKPIDFQKEIFPILEESCLRCHKAPKKDRRGRLRKPKGELRLDGKNWILQGGNTGPILVPGNAEQSSLWVRTTLEEDHPDVMPQGGELLTKVQQSLLKRWITEGASFGEWKGVLGGKAATSEAKGPKTDPYAALAEGLTSITPTMRKLIKGIPFTLRETSAGSPLLRAETYSFQEKVNDGQLKVLVKTIGSHLSHLHLAGTNISDASLERIAALPRLVYLDLRNTKVSSMGLRSLGNSKRLQVLNLVGCDIDSTATETLAAMTELKRLYLFETQLEDADIAKLRAALRKTKISHRFNGPSDKPKKRNEGRRRR